MKKRYIFLIRLEASPKILAVRIRDGKALPAMQELGYGEELLTAEVAKKRSEGHREIKFPPRDLAAN
jgi:hypothetical protein